MSGSIFLLPPRCHRVRTDNIYVTLPRSPIGFDIIFFHSLYVSDSSPGVIYEGFSLGLSFPVR